MSIYVLIAYLHWNGITCIKNAPIKCAEYQLTTSAGVLWLWLEQIKTQTSKNSSYTKVVHYQDVKLVSICLHLFLMASTGEWNGLYI